MDHSDIRRQRKTVSKNHHMLVIVMLILFLSPHRGVADPEKKNTPIHVTSDMLVSDRNANYAEFQGNVVAVQEGSTLTSDRLKITYAKQPESQDNPGGENDENPAGGIETIVATGNVKMTMEDKTAWAEMATFNRKDDTIVLTGGNPRVVSGKSTISGETIIMNRSTGQVSVLRGEGQRVEAFFYQEDMDKANADGAKQTDK